MSENRYNVWDEPSSGIDGDHTVRGRPEMLGRRFHIGETLLGRYAIQSELGQGGMGVVYKCFDSVGGIEVALKALPPELSHNSQEMEDLRENFALVSKLFHPHIAATRTLERDAVTGDYYLIMEYVPGMNLRSWLRQRRKIGKMSLQNVLPVLGQIASALDYAHSKKVLHRDIKPGNIMLETDLKGEVTAKVLDFGLAAEIRSSMGRVSNKIWATSGTRPYMAPEQWEGEKQDGRTDQYALAALVYEILSGSPPFAGAFETGDMVIMKAVVTNQPPKTLPELTQAQNAHLARALSKKPKERFASCGDLITAMSGGKQFSNPLKPKPPKSNSSFSKEIVFGVAFFLLWICGYLGCSAIQIHQNNKAHQAQVRIENEKSAAAAAQEALEVARRNEELRETQAKRAEQEQREQAESERQHRLNQYMDEARDAFARSDYEATSSALSRVFAEDANHAEAYALSENMKKAFGLREVIPVKVEAERRHKEVMALEGSDGLSQMQNDLQAKKQTADTYFEHAVYADAMSVYQKVIADAKTLKEAAEARTQRLHEEAEIARAKEEQTRGEAAEKNFGIWFKTAKTLEKRFSESGSDREINQKLKNETMIHVSEADGLDVESLSEKNKMALDEMRQTLETQMNALRLEPAAGTVQNFNLGGGVKLEMIYCPVGSFEMGSAANDERRYSDEPQHHVVLTRGFWIGKYEVTQAQWEVVMGSNPSRYRGKNLPVENVNWNDCQDFIRKLNSKTGQRFCLPTEAQWEYACRAGSTKAYSNTENLDSMGWYGSWEWSRGKWVEGSGGNSGGKTHPIGQKSPNAWGLYDMHGNVWEWCQDWYGDYPENAGTDPIGSATGSHRVNRGGSWFNNARVCRSASRNRYDPNWRDSNLGVRLALISIDLK